MSHILQPTTLGHTIPLRNRICMGSMTRNRCVDANKPTQSSVVHYADRARDGVGLIIAEGTFISPHGAEWPHAPVMYGSSHAAAWKVVTDAVHQEGGKIFFQPWHPGQCFLVSKRHLEMRLYRNEGSMDSPPGRIQNEKMPMLRETGYPVLAPSKIRAKGGKFRTLEGAPV